MPIVLHINSYSGTGSIGRIIDQICAKAQGKGWTCYVASGSRYSKLTSTTRVKFSSYLSEFLHFAISFLFDRQGLGSYFTTLLLIRKIKRIKPDVIHLHNLHGYYLHFPLLIRYLKKSKLPLVWTFHDCWNLTGHCVHFDYVGCHKWKEEGCHACPQLSAYPKSLFLDNSAHNFTLKKRWFTSLDDVHIVTVSHWLNGVVQSSFMNKYPIRTIYNGVDLDMFRFNPHSSLHLHDNCQFVLLGVAAVWTSRKGLSDYIQLRSQLDSSFKIVLIGLNDQQIAELPSGIVGLKRTTNIQELVDYYSECDVVLNLSYEETLGMTSIEGFACGKPTVVYNRTASPELVSAETGRVVEAGNIDELALTIREVCQSLSSFSPRTCRLHAEKNFNRDGMFQAYLDLYDEILNH